MDSLTWLGAFALALVILDDCGEPMSGTTRCNRAGITRPRRAQIIHH